jgi:hypothetical protein
MQTTCRNAGERHYVKGQCIATNCQTNYDINAICSKYYLILLTLCTRIHGRDRMIV